MEDIYLLEVDTLPDVVFADAEVLNYCCCKGFLPIHA